MLSKSSGSTCMLKVSETFSSQLKSINLMTHKSNILFAISAQCASCVCESLIKGRLCFIYACTSLCKIYLYSMRIEILSTVENQPKDDERFLIKSFLTSCIKINANIAGMKWLIVAWKKGNFISDSKRRLSTHCNLHSQCLIQGFLIIRHNYRLSNPLLDQ